MKIITVCGMGLGTSLILKMTVEDVMKKLGRKCSVEHWDSGTVDGKNADIIVTTSGFKKKFEGKTNVIFINNIMNRDEVQKAFEAYFAEKGL